ncbi:MAG: hypothetical protein ABJA67_14745 [Chthonomonadales bacterium]
MTIRLSAEEREWVRRRAYWDQISVADLFRAHLCGLIRQDGYLRPPDDEPQDFGYEKEIMQFVQSVQSEDS